MSTFSQLFLALVIGGFVVLLGALTWVWMYCREPKVRPAAAKTARERFHA